MGNKQKTAAEEIPKGDFFLAQTRKEGESDEPDAWKGEEALERQGQKDGETERQRHVKKRRRRFGETEKETARQRNRDRDSRKSEEEAFERQQQNVEAIDSHAASTSFISTSASILLFKYK